MQEKPENSAPNGKIGYTIDADFPCGNIKILKLEETEAQLAPDLRDTQGDWFYFHFRVRGAGGRTLSFTFPQDEISAFGAAVSADGVSYAFRPEKMRFTPREFTYAFGKDENEVYFAFSLPYPVRRFEKFARENKLSVRTLCVSEGGRNVPYLALGNEQSENCVVFTCRHHACESVASYVLEGAMQRLIQSANGAAGAGGFSGAEFLKTHALYIVPFIDVDGVENGDQGKNRAPHDHNRDYISQPIYNVTRAFLSLLQDKKEQVFADFHDPGLYGGINDYLSFVYGKEPDVALDTLAKIFENEMRGAYFPYEAENNTRLNTLWNVPVSSAKDHFTKMGAAISVIIETPYFGLKLPKEEAFIEIGSRFVSALDKYLKLCEKNCARDRNATVTAEQ